ncbi:hypothetical protein [Moritella yayanosii]|uniref:Uncharacterized protein n=1 Tax=Moritella yayanosii TaxID=69539 RepID=A0A330LLR0_9GAMM|nr:hypothetical protein [Moritella yayanosii]SQD76788.1 protein of unknown function [Moritella yayanosii]
MEAKLAVVTDLESKGRQGAYVEGKGFINDKTNSTLESSANTVLHENQHHVDAANAPVVEGVNYDGNRDEYADMIADDAVDYLQFNYSNNDKGSFGGFNLQVGSKGNANIAKNTQEFVTLRQENPDTVDYRTLTDTERSVIATLADGDATKERQLTAAGCALTRCSNQYTEGSDNYNYYKALEVEGAVEKDAQQVLVNYSDSGLVQGTTYPVAKKVVTENKFTYSDSDKGKDILTRGYGYREENLKKIVSEIIDKSGLPEGAVKIVKDVTQLAVIVLPAVAGSKSGKPATKSTRDYGKNTWKKGQSKQQTDSGSASQNGNGSDNIGIKGSEVSDRVIIVPK